MGARRPSRCTPEDEANRLPAKLSTGFVGAVEEPTRADDHVAVRRLLAVIAISHSPEEDEARKEMARLTGGRRYIGGPKVLPNAGLSPPPSFQSRRVPVRTGVHLPAYRFISTYPTDKRGTRRIPASVGAAPLGVQVHGCCITRRGR